MACPPVAAIGEVGGEVGGGLLDQLEQCCLTNAEMAVGQKAWLDLPDPFPAWRLTSEGDGETLD